MPSLVVFVLLVAVTALSGATNEPDLWYETLTKPTWTPPDIAFPVVWTLLYIAIAAAGWLVWQRSRRINLPLVLWAVQLLLNAAWSWLFFGRHLAMLAFVDTVLLLIAILAFIATAFRYSPLASALFMPYAIWVGFASMLNYFIAKLNVGVT